MTTHPTLHRGGQSRKYVKGPDGKEIFGLSLHKPTGRFYALDPKKQRVYFGRDQTEALFRFRQWEADRQQRVSFSKPLTASQLDDESSFGQQVTDLARPAVDVVIDEDGNITTETDLPADVFWAQVRQLLLTDLPEVRRRTGLHIEIPVKPEPSITLEALGRVYNERSKAVPRWKREVLSHWTEFTDALAPAKDVGDITIEHIRAYGAAVEAERERRKLSPTYVKSRFDSVRTVLRFARKQGYASSRLNEVLGYTGVLISPAHNTNDPHPISREHFHKILEVANAKFKAILLLSLNAALYPSEVASVLKEHVDLEKRTYKARRSKTGIARCAVLWPRTVDAIREYQRLFPHANRHLFVNRAYNKYQPHKLAQVFRRLRREAKVPSEVEFAHIRDGAASAADTGATVKGFDARQEEVLLGHRAAGVKDAYALRHPELVRDACAAVEAHYFGETEKTHKK